MPASSSAGSRKTPRPSNASSRGSAWRRGGPLPCLTQRSSSPNALLSWHSPTHSSRLAKASIVWGRFPCRSAITSLAEARQAIEKSSFELLVTLSRDPDTRTRQLTASAAAICLTHRRSTQAEAALLASLFDPHHGVVRNALGVIALHPPRLSTQVVRRRLPRELWCSLKRVSVMCAGAP